MNQYRGYRFPVDQYGYELDILVQPRRNTKVAVRFFKKLLKNYGYVPRVIITDELRSYTDAKRKILKQVEHMTHWNGRPF